MMTPRDEQWMRGCGLMPDWTADRMQEGAHTSRMPARLTPKDLAYELDSTLLSRNSSSDASHRPGVER